MFVSNPKAQYTSNKININKAIKKVLKSGQYILGKEVKLFEKEFSNYIGCKYSIGVSSGTEALNIALVASGILPNDEVITVSHTAVATVASILLAKAKPIFVDIDQSFYTIDSKLIEKQITKKTKAILVVHLYGQPADIKNILIIAKKYNLKLIEDCSQAHGAKIGKIKVGNFGDASVFSFYSTKNLGAVGDGGIITTNSSVIFKKCNLLRQYGWNKRQISNSNGWNSRLDELQAAILRVKLKKLNNDNLKRRIIAKFYNQNLKIFPIILPIINTSSYHVFHLYVIRLKKSERNKLKKFLEKKGIKVNIHYPIPIHKQLFYKKYDKKNKLNITEKISKQILSLPIYPELSLRKVSRIVYLIKKFYK